MKTTTANSDSNNSDSNNSNSNNSNSDNSGEDIKTPKKKLKFKNSPQDN
jgi:hypothetical protein